MSRIDTWIVPWLIIMTAFRIIYHVKTLFVVLNVMFLWFQLKRLSWSWTPVLDDTGRLLSSEIDVLSSEIDSVSRQLTLEYLFLYIKTAHFSQYDLFVLVTWLSNCTGLRELWVRNCTLCSSLSSWCGKLLWTLHWNVRFNKIFWTPTWLPGFKERCSGIS